MKLKIPPLVVVAISAFLMWSMDRYLLIGYSINFTGQRVISRSMFVICVIIMTWAVSFFRMKGTTMDPTNPDKASKLVQSGIYKFTRNPMYLAMLLLLIGWTLKLGNPAGALILAFFVWYMTKFQIKPEEEALTEIFGKEYTKYCERVRRWI